MQGQWSPRRKSAVVALRPGEPSSRVCAEKEGTFEVASSNPHPAEKSRVSASWLTHPSDLTLPQR